MISPFRRPIDDDLPAIDVDPSGDLLRLRQCGVDGDSRSGELLSGVAGASVIDARGTDSASSKG